MKAIRKPTDDREFQQTARMLNGIEGLDAKLPIIEWVPPSDTEIDSIIEQCKASSPGEKAETRTKDLTEEALQNVREAIKQGPYTSPEKWNGMREFCVNRRRIPNPPEWMDPPPEFLTGYWIPYETQTEIIKQIVNSSAPVEKVRGLCNAVEQYLDKSTHVATIEDINATAGLQLKPLEIGEESQYLPYMVSVFDAPRNSILISANHWREAKHNLRIRDDEEAVVDSINFDNVIEGFAEVMKTGNQDKMEKFNKFILTCCLVDTFGRRTEHYTDFYSGKLGLDFRYLNGLRDKWQQTPYHGRMNWDTVDTILYAIKMSENRTAGEEIANKFNEALAKPGDAWYKFFKQYEHLSAHERERNHLAAKCEMLGDTFLSDGGGIGTSRVNAWSDKYD